MTALPAIAAKVGDPVELGVNNTVGRQTALIRTRVGTALAVTAKGGGSPLKLVSKDGSPPMKVNSSAKVVRLNADRLDNRHADALLRVAFDVLADLPDGDTSTFTFGEGEPLSVSITAPTAGWLVITGTIDAFNFTGDDTYACFFRVDGSPVDGTTMGSKLDGTGSTNLHEDCTTHGVQEAAAGPHTVTFALIDVGTTTDFGSGSLSAMFVPFDGTGGTSSL